MKSFSPLFLSLTVMLGLGWTGQPVAAQDAPRDAVIVVRHAEDAELPGPLWGVPPNQPHDANWPSEAWKAICPKWPNYFYGFSLISSTSGSEGNITGNGDAVSISSHALSGHWKAGGRDGEKMKGGRTNLGEEQAIALGKHLNELVTKGNLAGINRAIVMNPQVSGATPNTFDTLWPYLNQEGEGKVSLLLVEYQAGQDKAPGMLAMIPRETETMLEKKLLDPNGGSTVICWTGEGLAGEGGILDALVTKYRGEGKYKDYQWDKVFIDRCEVIYVFYRRADGEGVAERWRFNYKTGEFTLEDQHPSAK